MGVWSTTPPYSPDLAPQATFIEDKNMAEKAAVNEELIPVCKVGSALDLLVLLWRYLVHLLVLELKYGLQIRSRKSD